MAIQINLVPESSRKKRKKSVLPLKSFQLPQEVVMGLAGGLVALLVVFHVVLQAFIFLRFAQLHHYQQATKKIVAQKAEADSVLQQLRKVQNNLSVIDGISKSKKISWAFKLNDVSDLISRGVWLDQVSLEEKRFVLKGSAVSKSGSEMIEVNNFIAKLKGSPTFSADFGRIEPGSIKTRKISNTSVADFTITAQLK